MMKEAESMQRRAILQQIVPASVGGALAIQSAAFLRDASSAVGNSNHAPRTLVLMCDRFHNQDYIRVGLDRLFSELGLPVDYTTNYYELSRKLLAPYKLFIAFRDELIWPSGYSSGSGEEGSRQPQDGLENPGEFPPEKAEYWITDDQGRAVKEFVAEGNGLYSMHNNAFVSRSSADYRAALGGVALGHAPVRPFKIRVTNKEHPITRGVNDFMVIDEQFFTQYDLDPKNILLQGENLDGLTYKPGRRQPEESAGGANGVQGQVGGETIEKELGPLSVNGWAHECGKGRVVFTSIGHTVDALWQPECMKIQKNAVNWLLKMS
jgi:type 1 glutamine amidotransferase